MARTTAAVKLLLVSLPLALSLPKVLPPFQLVNSTSKALANPTGVPLPFSTGTSVDSIFSDVVIDPSPTDIVEDLIPSEDSPPFPETTITIPLDTIFVDPIFPLEPADSILPIDASSGTPSISVQTFLQVVQPLLNIISTLSPADGALVRPHPVPLPVGSITHKLPVPLPLHRILRGIAQRDNTAVPLSRKELRTLVSRSLKTAVGLLHDRAIHGTKVPKKLSLHAAAAIIKKRNADGLPADIAAIVALIEKYVQAALALAAYIPLDKAVPPPTFTPPILANSSAPTNATFAKRQAAVPPLDTATVLALIQRYLQAALSLATHIPVANPIVTPPFAANSSVPTNGTFEKRQDASPPTDIATIVTLIEKYLQAALTLATYIPAVNPTPVETIVSSLPLETVIAPFPANSSIPDIAGLSTAAASDVVPLAVFSDIVASPSPSEVLPPTSPLDTLPIAAPVDVLPTDVPVDALPTEVPVDILPTELPEDVLPTELAVDTVPTEAPLFVFPTEAPVDVLPTEIAVDTLPTEAPVDLLPTELAVDTLPTEAPLFVLPTEAPVDVLPTELAVDTLPTEAPVFVLPTEAPVDTLPTELPVELLPTEAPVDTLPTEAPVDTLPTEAPVDTLPTEPSVDLLPAQLPTDLLPTEPPVDLLALTSPLDVIPPTAPLDAVTGDLPVDSNPTSGNTLPETLLLPPNPSSKVKRQSGGGWFGGIIDTITKAIKGAVSPNGAATPVNAETLERAVLGAFRHDAIPLPADGMMQISNIINGSIPTTNGTVPFSEAAQLALINELLALILQLFGLDRIPGPAGFNYSRRAVEEPLLTANSRSALGLDDTSNVIDVVSKVIIARLQGSTGRLTGSVKKRDVAPVPPTDALFQFYNSLSSSAGSTETISALTETLKDYFANMDASAQDTQDAQDIQDAQDTQDDSAEDEQVRYDLTKRQGHGRWRHNGWRHKYDKLDPLSLDWDGRRFIMHYTAEFHYFYPLLRASDPEIALQLAKILTDPRIPVPPLKSLKMGNLPDDLRRFVIDTYVFFQIIQDSSISLADKLQILQNLFAGIPNPFPTGPGTNTTIPGIPGGTGTAPNPSGGPPVPVVTPPPPAVTPPVTPPPVTPTTPPPGVNTQNPVDPVIPADTTQFDPPSPANPGVPADTIPANSPNFPPPTQPTRRSIRRALRGRQFDEGAELDDAHKLGPAALHALLGPNGSLDPMGQYGPQTPTQYDPVDTGNRPQAPPGFEITPNVGQASPYEPDYLSPEYEPKNGDSADLSTDDIPGLKDSAPYNPTHACS